MSIIFLIGVARVLTVQIFHNGRWDDAATIAFPSPDAGRGGALQLEYEQAYALGWQFHDNAHACSLVLPVDLMRVYRSPRWFGFLDDIMPAGASRRYWVSKLDLGHLSESQQDYALLRFGTIAPVGNLRIKESLPELPQDSVLDQLRFTVSDVVERHTDFLEYAQEMGAASGGATGAGGEAPKLLIRCSRDDQVWVDTFQNDLTTTDTHYLVKFPRGSRTQDDCDLLRTEYCYYLELAALGMDTVDVGKMRLIEGERYPTLWLPRFDVKFIDGQLTHYGLESVYSILNKGPGAHLNHFETLRALISGLEQQHSVVELGRAFDGASFAIEWVKRDLLNVVFGNSDNHGRNTALLKSATDIWLSPIYDFAPMKADPEGVTRTMKWGAPYEQGGQFDWHGIAQQLSDFVEPEQLIREMRVLCRQLVGLKSRLINLGAPREFLAKPVLGFDHLDATLKRWDLL